MLGLSNRSILSLIQRQAVHFKHHHLNPTCKARALIPVISFDILLKQHHSFYLKSSLFQFTIQTRIMSDDQSKDKADNILEANLTGSHNIVEDIVEKSAGQKFTVEKFSDEVNDPVMTCKIQTVMDKREQDDPASVVLGEQFIEEIEDSKKIISECTDQVDSHQNAVDIVSNALDVKTSKALEELSVADDVACEKVELHMHLKNSQTFIGVDSESANAVQSSKCVAGVGAFEMESNTSVISGDTKEASIVVVDESTVTAVGAPLSKSKNMLKKEKRREQARLKRQQRREVRLTFKLNKLYWCTIYTIIYFSCHLCIDSVV